MALQASAPDAVADLARRGLAPAVLSASMAEGLAGGGDADPACIPIAGIDVPAVLALVWKPGYNPALRELVHHCRAAFSPPAAA